MPDEQTPHTSEDQADDMTLRARTRAVLAANDGLMTYRDLTTALWDAYPDYKAHCFRRHPKESDARKEVRIRLGKQVRDYRQDFAATMSGGIVLVGLAATAQDFAAAADDDLEADAGTGPASVYWYTYQRYRASESRYPVKIGWGRDPEERVKRQTTGLPEAATFLGKRTHEKAYELEQALHAVLKLRGHHLATAPGKEWFTTTSEEVEALVDMLLG